MSGVETALLAATAEAGSAGRADGAGCAATALPRWAAW